MRLLRAAAAAGLVALAAGGCGPRAGVASPGTTATTRPSATTRSPSAIRVSKSAGPLLSVTVATGCPKSDRNDTGVVPATENLTRSLLPAGTPVAGLVCEYNGYLNGKRWALAKSERLTAAAAGALAVEFSKLPLVRSNEPRKACVVSFGIETVVAFQYSEAGTVDLWVSPTGCDTTSNGQVEAWGTPAGLSAPVFPDRARHRGR